MAKYIGEFGKRWDARVPRSSISWLAQRWHVSRPAAEIEQDIRSRCTAPGYTEALLNQAVAYALECHKHNRSLFDAVNCGRF